jgi:Ni/Co efflux regulator RcnB
LAAAHARPPRSKNGQSFSYRGHSRSSFVVAPYAWPGGYGYQRMYAGAYLPEAFWDPSYFIEDYDYYGVGAPPPNFRWIRYGADLLLIDLDTGRIADEIYGLFAETGRGGPARQIADAGQTGPDGDPDEMPDDPAPPR